MVDTKNVENIITREFNSCNSVYRPNQGEMVCYFTPTGIYGPIPFYNSSAYVTFATQVPLRQPVEDVVHDCISALRDQISIASAELAHHCNHDVDFVYLQLLKTQCKLVRKYLMISMDISIVCVHQSKSSLFDWLDF